MQQFIKSIIELLTHGTTVAVATIAGHSGSTPRTSGTRMIILSDGTINGTIGGGLIEAEVIKTAISLIPEKGCVLKAFSLNRTEKESLDMICGGNLIVLIEVVDPKQLPLYAEILKQINARKKCIKVSELTCRSNNRFSIKQCLVTASGEVTGEDIIPKPISGNFLAPHFKTALPAIIHFGGKQIFIDPVRVQESLFLFGAGHVALEVARLSTRIGFQTTVIDDRAEFADKGRFDTAHEVRVVNNFSESFERLAIDSSSYIVILTRGHLHDQTVLKLALNTRANYIGMIGSNKKRDEIYANLEKQGFSSSDLARVHSPIGITIHAETPEEIAVSIAAELIAVKNKRS